MAGRELCLERWARVGEASGIASSERPGSFFKGGEFHFLGLYTN
jgi:hypothetical protein